MIINNNKYTDIPFFLSKNEYTNDINLTKDANVIRSCVKNLLMTVPGERPFNNELGSKLSIKSDAVNFNNRLEYNALVDHMYRSVNNNDSRIVNLNIRVIENKIDIQFNQKNEEITYNLNFKVG